MSPTALLHSWSLPPVVTATLVLSAICYLRGWWIVRRADESLLPSWRAGAFLSGLGFIWIALASPLDALNELLLTAHMLQHMLLMMVAPPLILLGAPLVPIVRGLPGALRRSIGSFLNWSATERIGPALANPIAGALAMGLVMFAWHIPRLYESALGSEFWHEVEHSTFLLASLMFWWPVVLPWPSRGQWPRWAMVPYLLVADLQNTALSAILTFSDRVLYRSYANAPRLGVSALQDQIAAGSFMWVAGSVAFILPAIGVAVHCLSTRSTRDVMSHIAASGS
jgi:cytochrome c oxidase assembly factor CtaG